MNNLIRLTATAIIITGISACSSKQLYGAGQNYQKSECIKKAVTAAEHEACNNTKQPSYKEYEQEREKVIDK